MTIKQIEDEVLKADPGITRDKMEFKAAVVLLSALHVGQDVNKLSKFTKVPKSVIQKFKDNLTKNRVWRRGKTYCEWNAKDGMIAFWMDCCVAMGLMNWK